MRKEEFELKLQYVLDGISLSREQKTVLTELFNEVFELSAYPPVATPDSAGVVKQGKTIAQVNEAAPVLTDIAKKVNELIVTLQGTGIISK